MDLNECSCRVGEVIICCCDILRSKRSDWQFRKHLARSGGLTRLLLLFLLQTFWSFVGFVIRRLSQAPLSRLDPQIQLGNKGEESFSLKHH